MQDPQDIVEIGGLRLHGPDPAHVGRGRPSISSDQPLGPGRQPFLGVHFTCCHVYGRLVRNREGTHYRGRCPRCGAPVDARIAPGGTGQRFFEAR